MVGYRHARRLRALRGASRRVPGRQPGAGFTTRVERGFSPAIFSPANFSPAIFSPANTSPKARATGCDTASMVGPTHAATVVPLQGLAAAHHSRRHEARRGAMAGATYSVLFSVSSRRNLGAHTEVPVPSTAGPAPVRDPRRVRQRCPKPVVAGYVHARVQRPPHMNTSLLPAMTSASARSRLMVTGSRRRLPKWEPMIPPRAATSSRGRI